MKIFILATCRKPELLPYTTLVFDTLRVGFPDWSVEVHSNQLPHDAFLAVKAKALTIGAMMLEFGPTIHHEWIEHLVRKHDEPFLIMDTDLIFYEDMQEDILWSMSQGGLIGGYLIPEFVDQFSRSITRSRIHTSLMWMDPVVIRDTLKLRGKDTEFTPSANPFYPLRIPFGGELYFYDTCSVLFHTTTTGAVPFGHGTKNKYFHFHFGTIPDVVLPELTQGRDLEKARAYILSNPVAGRGMWRNQDAFYAAHQFQNTRQLSNR